MKHTAVDFHYVRKQVQQKQVEVVHIYAIDQLPKTAFDRHLFKLGIVVSCLPLGGRIGRSIFLLITL